MWGHLPLGTCDLRGHPLSNPSWTCKSPARIRGWSSFGLPCPFPSLDPREFPFLPKLFCSKHHSVKIKSRRSAGIEEKADFTLGEIVLASVVWLFPFTYPCLLVSL